MTDPAPTQWFDFPGAPAPGSYLCALTDIPDGGVRMCFLENAQAAGETSTGIAPFGTLILRSGDTVRAYLNRCAHFGVPLAKTPAHLIFTPHVSITCNVHYARYRWEDGYCDRGDCVGESLVPVPVTIGEDGRIFIAA